MSKTLLHDPRTIARDIPGISEILFPQLTPGIIAHLNRSARHSEGGPVEEELVQECTLPKAMLFELSIAVGESLILSGDIDWKEAISLAVTRQRKYFDAAPPELITELDKNASKLVARNLISMIEDNISHKDSPILVSPNIPGCKWCDSGVGDFAIATTLIEVKCTSRNFTAPDYRQLLMYWLLSYISSIESEEMEWTHGVLLNPRSAKFVLIDFTKLLQLIGGGRSKVEISQLFFTLLDENNQ